VRALAAIGGPGAAQAVARLLTRKVILGPGLKVAVGAAAQLKSNLPPAVLSALLRHDDPSIRAAACCCTRAIPEIVSVLIDLLEDLHEPVAIVADHHEHHVRVIQGHPAAHDPVMQVISESSASVFEHLLKYRDHAQTGYRAPGSSTET
jgi:hypothetical protein